VLKTKKKRKKFGKKKKKKKTIKTRVARWTLS
jgi:hypothetical protein